MNLQTKNPLFDHLDECGIDFRKPMSELIDIHGWRNCGWSDDLNYCELQSDVPFVCGLAHPLVFQFFSGVSSPLPANFFKSYIRSSADCHENYRFAEVQLKNIFGDGEDCSSSNTRSFRWRFGMSSVRITIFPPELNRSRRENSRHRKIENSQNECTVSMELNWARDVTNAERDWLVSYTPFYTKTASERSFRFMPGRTCCWPNELEAMPIGFGFDENTQVLINVSNNSLVTLIPIAWIVGVVRSSLLHAKARAESSILIKYLPSGTNSADPASLTLVSSEGDPYVYNSLAIELSQKLNVALYEYEQPNC